MSVLSLESLAKRVAALRAEGRRVVHCHGVFDLLHVGHVKHLQAARALGDALVVTLTPDPYVDKGPHRPAFPSALRAEALDALACVDHVGINRWPTAVEIIGLLKADLFCKGAAPGEGQRDFNDAILREKAAIEAVGGALVFTRESTFSSTTLINQHLDPYGPVVGPWLAALRPRFPMGQVVASLERLRALRVLVVGETIVDAYVRCRRLGLSSKAPTIVAQRLGDERHAGGVAAIAAHLRPFCGAVSVLTDLDGPDLYTEPFDPCQPAPGAVVKRRYLDEESGARMFELYELPDRGPGRPRALAERLDRALDGADLVIVGDYGHGLLDAALIERLCDRAPFLAVNAQSNAGNAGFNSPARYPRADLFTLDEREARLETRLAEAEPEALLTALERDLGARRVLLTLGARGCVLGGAGQARVRSPALPARVVDPVGAGDAVLAMVAAGFCAGLDTELVLLLGAVAGAEACAVPGNARGLDRARFLRHLNSLLG